MFRFLPGVLFHSRDGICRIKPSEAYISTQWERTHHMNDYFSPHSIALCEYIFVSASFHENEFVLFHRTDFFFCAVCCCFCCCCCCHRRLHVLWASNIGGKPIAMWVFRHKYISKADLSSGLTWRRYDRIHQQRCDGQTTLCVVYVGTSNQCDDDEDTRNENPSRLWPTISDKDVDADDNGDDTTPWSTRMGHFCSTLS